MQPAMQARLWVDAGRLPHHHCCLDVRVEAYERHQLDALAEKHNSCTHDLSITVSTALILSRLSENRRSRFTAIAQLKHDNVSSISAPGRFATVGVQTGIHWKDCSSGWTGIGVSYGFQYTQGTGIRYEAEPREPTSLCFPRGRLSGGLPYRRVAFPKGRLTGRS